VHRSFSSKLLRDVLKEHEEFCYDFDPAEWLDNSDNIMITDENSNITLWELGSDGIYTAHVFFKDKGKKAKALALEMIDKFWFISNHKIVRGMTPLENLPARWMARQLGFKSYGVVSVLCGPCELFILTKDNNRSN